MTATDTPTTYGGLHCISLLLPGLDLQVRRVKLLDSFVTLYSRFMRFVIGVRHLFATTRVDIQELIQQC